MKPLIFPSFASFPAPATADVTRRYQAADTGTLYFIVGGTYRPIPVNMTTPENPIIGTSQRAPNYPNQRAL